MRKVFSFFICAFLALTILSGLSSSAAAGGSYVRDDTGLLSSSMVASLNDTISEMRDTIQADVLVVFTNDASVTGDDARKAAETANRVWVTNGGGYGDDHESILLYVNMNARKFFVDEYNLSSSWLLSDAQIDAIVEKVGEKLSDGDYDGAAQSYVNMVKRLLGPGFFSKFYSWILVGLAGGGIATGAARGKQPRAVGVPKSHYRKGGLQVVRQEDIYRDTRVERRVIQQENRSSGSTSSSSGSSGHHGGGGSF